MVDPSAVAEILVQHALQHCRDDVAIVMVYGSRAKKTASPLSDLDICYIPDDGAAQSLSSQFVLDGLPYDFWPLSWSFADAIANATSGRPWAYSASLIADAKVLHHRSQADLDRFRALQRRVDELTRPECRPLMLRKAMERFRVLLSELGLLRIALSDGDATSAVAAGWRLHSEAVNCLALANQAYFSRGLGRCLPQVLALPRRPDGLEALLRGLAMPAGSDEMLAHGERLALAIRELLLNMQAETVRPVTPQEAFCDYYPCVVEYVGKILSACERGDALAAGAAAYTLQEELSRMLSTVEPGLQVTESNLLGEYSAAYRQAGFPDLLATASRGDLALLADEARKLEVTMAAWLTERGVATNVLADGEQLRRFLARRAERG